MNAFQLARQVRYLLRERKWEASPSNEHVFQSGSVRISAKDFDSMMGTKASPLCKINIGPRTSDQQTKGYVALKLLITLGVTLEGDDVGENAIIGANRTAGKVSSKGRGISEVESELFAVLQELTQQQGIQMQGYATSAIEVVDRDDASSFVTCDYEFLFYATTQLTYLGPTSLLAVGSTGGGVSLSWVPAPTNWASVAASGGQVVCYNAGTTPPSIPTGGTPAPAITGIATSLVVTGLASGTYAFSVFTIYKELSATADRYSPPTSYVVVVP